jgi:hypothetical protein
MHSFHVAPYLSESHFAYAKPKGGQRICASGHSVPGVETPRGTNGLDAANRLRRPEWNNLGEAIVSGAERQVSTVQLLKAFASERRSFTWNNLALTSLPLHDIKRECEGQKRDIGRTSDNLARTLAK